MKNHVGGCFLLKTITPVIEGGGGWYEKFNGTILTHHLKVVLQKKEYRKIKSGNSVNLMSQENQSATTTYMTKLKLDREVGGGNSVKRMDSIC